MKEAHKRGPNKVKGHLRHGSKGGRERLAIVDFTKTCQEEFFDKLWHIPWLLGKVFDYSGPEC